MWYQKIPGFINVDIDKSVDPDIIDDIKILSKFDNNSVDLIYSCHVLEHVDRHEFIDVLQRWYDILKQKGTLRIAVPDFQAVCEHYIINKNISLLHGLMWGGQKNKYDYHNIGFDFYFLSKILYDIGFSNVKRYNWKDTEHYYIDDYSQCYLPHMDKTSGKLLSLNIEAIK